VYVWVWQVGVEGHGGLFIPTARNANDRDLPAFTGGKSPDTPCTCAQRLLPAPSCPPRELGACRLMCSHSCCCHLVNRCANGLPTVSPPKEPVAQIDAGTCWSDAGMNYNSHPHNIVDKPGATPSACCSLCAETPGCKFWTHLGQTCYLKNSTAGRTHLAGAVSGGSGAKPPLPSPPSPHGRGATGGECDQGLRVNGGGQ